MVVIPMKQKESLLPMVTHETHGTKDSSLNPPNDDVEEDDKDDDDDDDDDAGSTSPEARDDEDDELVTATGSFDGISCPLSGPSEHTAPIRSRMNNDEANGSSGKHTPSTLSRC